MSCNKKISASLASAACELPVVGLQDAVLINFDDIDRSATVVAGEKVTSLELASGTTGYAVAWFRNLASTSSTFEASEDSIPGFKHSFLSRLSQTTTENSKVANELAYGRFVMVVRTRFEGTDQADRYKVYGVQNGMIATEIVNTSNENDGSITFTLASDSISKESHPYHVYFETDALTSQTAYTALFAQA